MHFFSGLHAIELSDNPWICDCRLQPLKEWLTEANVPYLHEPKCASPAPRLTGKVFSQLRLDEFACPPELLTMPRYVEANTGEHNSLGRVYYRLHFMAIAPSLPKLQSRRIVTIYMTSRSFMVNKYICKTTMPSVIAMVLQC